MKTQIRTALFSLATVFATSASAEVNVDTLKSFVDALAKTKVSGFLQGRYEYALDTSTLDAKSSQLQGRFTIKRGRVIVSNEGTLGDFSVQVQYAEDGIKLIDAYASAYDPTKSVRLRMGSQVLPFGWEVGQWGSAGMEVLERSLAEQSLLNGEHDIGAVLALTAKDDFLQYLDVKVGVFNGTMNVVGLPILGSSANGASQTDFDDGKAFTGRVGFKVPQKLIGLDLSGGVSYYYDILTSAQDTVIDFAGQLSNTNGTSHISVGNVRKDLDKSLLGVDLQAGGKFTDLGASVLRGELYTGTNVAQSSGAVFDPYSSSLPTSAAASVATNKAYVRNALGWYVLLAQSLGPVQVAGRFEQYDPNTDVGGSDIGVKANTAAADIAWTQLSGAVSYNLSGNVKLTVEYDHKTNEHIGKAFAYKAGTDSRNYTGDVQNDKATFQLQTKF